MISDFAPAPDDPSAPVLRFRELDGHVESRLAGIVGGPQARALWLLHALTAELWRNGASIEHRELTLAEFDAALAHVYRSLYGARMPSEAACTACGEAFEFALDLAMMQEALTHEASAIAQADGLAADPDSGRRFRLPRIGDLQQLHAEGPEAWMRSLLLEGAYDPAMEDEIARAAPLLSQDVKAECPGCGADNRVRFDIARYLVQTLEAETGFLWREVHLIAQRYGWALDDILSLTRSVRRRLAALIVADSAVIRAAS